MKELRIFAIIVFLSGILYWGIEPFAHSKLSPHKPEANFDFAKEDIEHVIDENQSKIYKDFWSDIKSIDLSKGDPVKGKELIESAGCISCHGITTAGFQAPLDNASASDSFNVVPPDLSTAGAIYDEYFLAALIKNPVMALRLTHKYDEEKPFPMTAYDGSGADIADIISYLKMVSEKYKKDHETKDITGEEIFADSCQRCHDIRYDKKYALTDKKNLLSYLGSNPPDLSIIIRAKNQDDYLNKFLNDPQKMLPGTAMQRIGLTKQSQEKVIGYLEKVGDAKKDQRSTIGIYAIIYFLILGIFAVLWKRKIWKDFH